MNYICLINKGLFSQIPREKSPLLSKTYIQTPKMAIIHRPMACIVNDARQSGMISSVTVRLWFWVSRMPFGISTGVYIKGSKYTLGNRRFDIHLPMIFQLMLQKNLRIQYHEFHNQQRPDF